MKDHIYSLYNVLSKRYINVMSFPSDGMAVHQLSRTKDLDKKLFELCRIGSIEIETGVMEPCPPKRLDWEAEEELPKTEAE